MNKTNLTPSVRLLPEIIWTVQVWVECWNNLIT